MKDRFTDSGNSANPNDYKPKENYAQKNHKLLENED